MKFSLFFLFAFSGLSVFGQTGIPVEYVYDDAGNRVMRRVVELRMGHQTDGCADTSHYQLLLNTTKMSVYPNPTDGVVTMELPAVDRQKRCVAKVYDSKGRPLFECAAVSGVIKVDLSGHPAGHYIVELTVGDERSAWKIIKR